LLVLSVAAGREQDWSVSYQEQELLPPTTDQDQGLDKIQVVSSAIRVLPRNGKTRVGQLSWSRSADQSHRRKRETVEAIRTWRRPRQHQFVTSKSDRLPPPPIVRVYPPSPLDRVDRYNDYNGFKKQRRIIYYATLPEIVRPPVPWYDRGNYYDSRRNYPQPSPSAYSPSYTPAFSSPSSDDETTRVQSNIIDVTGSRYDRYSGSNDVGSRYDRYSASTPKFTIIDVDPPYHYPFYERRPPHRYDYPSSTPTRFDIRTPPYRDSSHHSYRPDPSLQPVKLQAPTTAFPSSTNTTNLTTNSTRLLPDSIPVSLRSLSQYVS